MSSDRRRLLVLAGVAAVVLLAALVLPRVLFGGGADEGSDETASSPSTTVGPGPDGVPFDGGTAPSSGAGGTDSADDGVTGDPSASELFTTRNPFTPLVETETGDDGADESGTGDTSGTTQDESASGGEDDSTDGTDDASPLPDEPSDVPADDGGGGATSSSFSLVDVYPGADGSPVANVEVDDELYTVAEGESFGGRYQVVSLSSESGVGTFRDEQGEFTLTEGEAQLK